MNVMVESSGFSLKRRSLLKVSGLGAAAARPRLDPAAKPGANTSMKSATAVSCIVITRSCSCFCSYDNTVLYCAELLCGLLTEK
jgi:hypothetical protein